MTEESSLRSEESDDDSSESLGFNIVQEKNIVAHATTRLLFEKPDIPRVLTRNEASKCLYGLGKCDEGTKYAYLAIDVSNRNLTDISIIPTFKFLLRVNVSGNRLTRETLAVLTSMPYLLMLEANENELLSADLEPMPYLQVFCLNRNCLQDISYISHNLIETLELNYNRINSIDLNPYALKNLKNLQVRGNIITKLDSLKFTSLERLYLAENEIEDLDGVDNLVSLRILHLRDNRLKNLNGFTAKCASLKYLNVRQNSITLISEIKKLSCLPVLETLIISENPVVMLDENREDEKNDDKEDNYRITVIALLPGLKRLNKDSITVTERQEAEYLKKQWRADGNGVLNNRQNSSDYALKPIGNDIWGLIQEISKVVDTCRYTDRW